MPKQRQYRIIAQSSTGIRVTTKATAKEAAETAAHEFHLGSEVHVEDEAGNTIESDQLAKLIKQETDAELVSRKREQSTPIMKAIGNFYRPPIFNGSM